jgi:hypothetical protein
VNYLPFKLNNFTLVFALFICAGKNVPVIADVYCSKGSGICRLHYINSVESYLSGGYSVAFSKGFSFSRYVFALR